MQGTSGFQPPLLSQIQAEVEQVMRPTGSRFEWRPLDLTKTNKPACSLLIVRFEGDCRFEGSCKPRPRPFTLGWTHVTDGEVLPFCGVDCDLVRQVIASELQSRPEGEQERLFARALGRVVAHEFYHILADTRSHSGRGLAQRFFSAGDLLASDAGFDDTAVEAMVRGLQEVNCPASDADTPLLIGQ
jgi:hypothetical protein